MGWIAAILDWARSHEALLWWLFAASVALALLTPMVVAWAVVRLPTHYFIQKRRRPLATWQHRPAMRHALLVVKNLVGIVLLVAGLAMLVLPGQGLLVIAVGVILVDFPGKFGFERWLATRRPVWRSINWLRKLAGRPELKRP